MSTFFMYGKYSTEAVKAISPERTDNVISLVKNLGGEVNEMYVLLGGYDLVFIVDLPGNKEAIQASVGLNRLTDISFSTSPAITVEEFDKMIAET